MNWMPSIPTDNLYKFAAISGLWMLIGLLFFFGWLISIDIQMDEERKATNAYYGSLNLLREVNRRQEAIKSGKGEEARIEWMDKSLMLEDEIKMLGLIAQAQQQNLEEYKPIMNSDYRKKLGVLERTDVRVFGALYLIFAVYLFVGGFRRWYSRIHKIDLELKELDLMRMKKELRKLDLELQMKRRAFRRRGLNLPKS